MTRPDGGVDGFVVTTRSVAILVAVILVSGIAIGTLAFVAFGGHRNAGTTQAAAPPPAPYQQTATATVTETTQAKPPPCDAAPRVEVTSTNLTDNGLTMNATFSTACDEGDTLTGNAAVLSAAQGTRDFASGTFDLDTNPIVMPANGSVRRTLIFPDGTYWRGPELVQSGAMDVDVADATHSGNDTGQAGSSTLTADAAANPGHGSLDGTATHALQELADYDRGYVSSTLQNFWVPQISSKKVGIHADGIVYSANEILRNHFKLRERYPNVKLVSSNDWTTFGDADFWISVVGQTYYTGPLANNWCDQNGIGAGDCFAKVISSTFGPEGTTMMRN